MRYCPKFLPSQQNLNTCRFLFHMKNDILYSICPQIVEAAIYSFEQISRKKQI